MERWKSVKPRECEEFNNDFVDSVSKLFLDFCFVTIRFVSGVSFINCFLKGNAQFQILIYITCLVYYYSFVGDWWARGFKLTLYISCFFSSHLFLTYHKKLPVHQNETSVTSRKKT